MCDQNLVFGILKHIIALLCFVMFFCSCYAKNLLRFLLVLKFLCFVSELTRSKFSNRPKVGPSYSNSEIVRNLGHTPSFQHQKG